MVAPIPVVASDDHRAHAPLAEIESSGLQAPFEHPGRADAIRAVLDADRRFAVTAPARFGTAPIEEVHDPGLVAFLASAWSRYQVAHPGVHDVVPDMFEIPALFHGFDDATRSDNIDLELGRWAFETTTPITEGSFAAACASVDIAMTAAHLVLDGEPLAYGLCRPPGHHAPMAAYGGYCFFNNAAIVAQHIVGSTGSRVAIVDVDYHHGNGTQQIFYRRDDVVYGSLHGDPDRAYPYLSGRADEAGAGPGRGANLNVPLPPGADDGRVLDALEALLGAVEKAGAELIVVSLGVDTADGDPISDLAVTPAGFHDQGRLIAELDRPVVVVQEGGYDVATIGANVAAFLAGASGVRPSAVG